MTRAGSRWMLGAVFAALLVAGCALWALFWPGGRGETDGPAAAGGGSQRELDHHRQGFREAAAQSGLDFKMSFLPTEQGENFKTNLYDHGCGVVVGDYNGDGHDDVFFLNQLGSNGLYRNRGDGTFANETDSAGVGLADRICVGGTFGDYDNDADQDLFVTSTRGGNVLFENVGNGRFKDVTRQAGVELVAHSQTAAFFDPDADGDLDLLVTNSAAWTSSFNADVGYYVGPMSLGELFQSPKEYNVFYRNQGNGQFVDDTQAAGLAGKGWGGDVALFDYDADGDIDVFVTNMFGLSQLYGNDGQGRYRDVTAETLKRTSFGAIGSKAFDYNNDGRFDLLSVDMHSDMWVALPEGARTEPRPSEKHAHLTGGLYDASDGARRIEDEFADLFNIQYEQVIFGNALLENEGNGAFKEVSDRVNLETFWPWGVAVGDFDNDSYEDVFLPAGMGYPFWHHPSSLMMNQDGRGFVDRALLEGIEPPPGGVYLPETIGGRKATRSSRAAATGDFNGDGRLDLVVNNFNDHPYYFINQFPERNWLALRLTGQQSNRDAIGAVVTVELGQGKKLVKQVHSAGGYLSQSSKTLHFGLGDAQRVERVEIRWPNGKRQTIRAPKINQLLPVKELKS